jgi:hypothetical protein
MCPPRAAIINELQLLPEGFRPGKFGGFLRLIRWYCTDTDSGAFSVIALVLSHILTLNTHLGTVL